MLPAEVPASASNGQLAGALCLLSLLSPPGQPLSQVLQQRPLTRYRMQRILTTREEDLASKDPPPTLRSLEAYGEGTASQLLQLQVMVQAAQAELAW